MKKRIIALALVIVMALALAACGKEEAAPADEVQPPVADVAPAQQGEAQQPVEAPVGITPDSGVITYTNELSGISFDYDTKFVAMENQAGNAVIYAGTEAGLPFCVVSVQEFTEAQDYLKNLVAGLEVELGSSIKTKAEEPKKLDNMGERDIYYIYYTHEDKEAGGIIATAYYAENLADSRVVVFSSNALENQTAEVDEIISLAIKTFKLVEAQEA